jgi:2-polyprenyl-6-methoxyphenol hydroxylase-like FAD-dependent oxidoreductase
MRVVIVGGGVAGPAVGLALSRVGAQCVVVERRETLDSTEGSYLTVAANGVDALDTLGCLDTARQVGFETSRNVMYGATGRRLGDVGLGPARKDGLRALTLKRSALAAAVADQARRAGVEIRTGTTAGSVNDDGEQAHVRLADGSELTADLVVGADGVHSRVRRALDRNAPGARYVGLTNFGGITRETPLARDLRPEAWHFVFGSRAFFGAHPTPDGDVVWFLNVPEPEISRERRAATSEQQWQEGLIDLVARDAGPAHELVRTGELELAADNTYDLAHVPVWFRDRTVILGDAAHAPSPSSGQGASMALEDALVLAQAVRDNAAIPTALAAYARARRSRVERIVKVGARSSSSKIPGPLGRRMQESMMRPILRYLVTDESTAWMNGHRVDWTSTVR